MYNMNIKDREEYKAMFYFIDFCSPSVWHVLEVQKVCGRKKRREGGRKGDRKGWREGGSTCLFKSSPG